MHFLLEHRNFKEKKLYYSGRISDKKRLKLFNHNLDRLEAVLLD
jgi:hypothetical protein